MCHLALDRLSSCSGETRGCLKSSFRSPHGHRSCPSLHTSVTRPTQSRRSKLGLSHRCLSTSSGILSLNSRQFTSSRPDSIMGDVLTDVVLKNFQLLASLFYSARASLTMDGTTHIYVIRCTISQTCLLRASCASEVVMSSGPLQCELVVQRFQVHPRFPSECAYMPALLVVLISGLLSLNEPYHGEGWVYQAGLRSEGWTRTPPGPEGK